MENETKKLNPGPLGLIGFGLATILLNIHNLGLINLSNAIIALGFALGGLVQMISGLYEFKKQEYSCWHGIYCLWWILVLTRLNLAFTWRGR